MTLLDARPEELLPPTEGDEVADAPKTIDAADVETGDDQPVSATMVALAALLSTGAAAWMAGGILRGAMFARAIGVLGAVIGVGGSWLASRPKPDGERRPSLHFAILPVAAIAGAALVAPVAKGGTANLFGLIGEALRSGGVVQPPMPFDPGWRFILVVLFAVIGAASVMVAVGTAKPKLAFLLPLPVTFAAAVVQPPGAELIGSAVASFLAVASMAIAFGAGLARGGDVNAKFEIRRLARGLVMLVAATIAIVLLAQADILFPSSERDRVIPPQRPPNAPLEPDRELFVARGERTGPWRTGVLDVYDGEWWLLPSIDQSRIVDLADGAVPDAKPGPDDDLVEFAITDMKGRALPVPAGLVQMRGDGAGAEFDPRTGVPRVKDRIPRGYEYTAVARPLPTNKAMAEAPPANPAVQTEFAAIPGPPNAVASLLAEAPVPVFDRVQFLRDRLYANVVAAGSGSPVAVPPARVGAMFNPGAEATPFEITAAEALLARWAGAPSRIGYGYFGGEKVDGGFSFRPKHGAAWLEVYFEGHGWVPLVGVPPRAKSSLSTEEQQNQTLVRPSDELAVSVLIPVRRPTYLMLFEILRYWLLVLTPFAALAAALVVSYPALLKRVRSVQRRRWALRRGPVAQILVEYAEFRDLCYDLNIGDPRDTPGEFVAAFVADDEHEELAWLVTRALWGDVKRDCRADDAAAAEVLTRSVTSRLLRELTIVNRLLASVSRTSLRDPYSDQIPNFYPDLRVDRRIRAAVRRGLRAVRPGRWRPVGASVLCILMALSLGGCVKQGGLTGASAAVAYPERIAPPPPERLLGLEFVRDAPLEQKYREAGDLSLVSEGHVYALRDGSVVQGTLQVALFKPEVDSQNRGLRNQILSGAGGFFRPYPVGTSVVLHRESPEQRTFIWFPPERNVMQTLVFRKKYADYDRVLRALLAFQRQMPAELVDDFVNRRAPFQPVAPEVMPK